jgi:DNA-binding TFAR19-related protein (PDSD5 family)
MANQNVAYSAAMSILQQTRGKVTQKISEEELKKILSQVASSQRREFNITRK